MDASRSGYKSAQANTQELDEAEAQKRGNTEETTTMQAEDAEDDN
jgi:hypothetical protein